jgi:hypothetical protein
LYRLCLDFFHAAGPFLLSFSLCWGLTWWRLSRPTMGEGAEGMENAASTDGCGGGHRRVEATASNIGSEVGGGVHRQGSRRVRWWDRSCLWP